MSKIEQIFQIMIEKIEKMPVAELDEKLEKIGKLLGLQWHSFYKTMWFLV